MKNLERVVSVSMWTCFFELIWSVSKQFINMNGF